MVQRLQQLFSQFTESAALPVTTLEQLQQTAFMTTLPAVKSVPPLFDNVSTSFQAIAEQHHNHTALITTDGEFSYQQLQQRAQMLAASFYQAGLRPGDLVAVCLPRDSRLIVTLLAIFRCQA